MNCKQLTLKHLFTTASCSKTISNTIMKRPEKGFLFHSLDQLAHLPKKELYDFVNLSLHDERTRSVAV